MMPVNGSILYNLGADLQLLETLRPGRLIYNFDRLQNAQARLDHFLHSHVLKPTTSLEKGENLLAYIKALVAKGQKEQEGGPASNISDADVDHLVNKLREFTSAFTSEIAFTNLYVVFQKRGYNPTALLNNASVLFPDDLLKKVPKVTLDVQEVGRCIAFELPTAAGFHIHRVNETVVRSYYDVVTNNAQHPERQSMGNYLQALETQKRGAADVIASLRDINKLHRNPLIHPEQSLESIDDALTLLGAVRGAVAYMLREIP